MTLDPVEAILGTIAITLLVLLALGSAPRGAGGGGAARRARGSGAKGPADALDAERTPDWLVTAFKVYATLLVVAALAFAAVSAFYIAPEFLAFDKSQSLSERAEAFLRVFGPSALVLAGFVAVLSVPLVIFRALMLQEQTRTQTEQQRTAEENLREARRSRDQIEKNAQRADVTQRYLRAIELLGAVRTVTTVEPRRLTDHIVDVSGQTRPIEREVATPVTRQEPAVEIRLGALVTLQAIARDNIKDYHWEIMQMLLAYLRERRQTLDVPLYLTDAEEERLAARLEHLATAPEEREEVEDRIGLIKWRLLRRRRARFGKLSAEEKGVPEDLRTIATILRERRPEQVAWEWLGTTDVRGLPSAMLPDAPTPEAVKTFLKPAIDAWERPARPYELDDTPFDHLDLRGIDLRRQNLRQARMQGADLREARIQGAVLGEARVQGAHLDEAHLQGADLREAQMQGAVLCKARMQGADLRKARMQGADLREARMQRADLREAQMRGADLGEAQMQGADLREARMQGVVLGKAQMQEADLREARMQEADLGEAQMQGANLREAWLKGAVLREAQLQEAILTEARMVGAVLREAQLQRANLIEAQMQRAELYEARMEGAILREAQMHEADLRWAQMRGTDLREAQMQQADLRWAQMQQADLREAWMQGADLREARMQGADLRGARMRGAFVAGVDFGRASKGGEEVKGLTEKVVKSMLGDCTAFESIPAAVVEREGLRRPKEWDWKYDLFDNDGLERWESFKKSVDLSDDG